MDLFQPARLDKTHSVEEVVQTLKEMVDEGLFSYIGLSEVNAETGQGYRDGGFNDSCVVPCCTRND